MKEGKVRAIVEEVQKFTQEGRHIWRANQLAQLVNRRLDTKVTDPFVSTVLRLGLDHDRQSGDGHRGAKPVASILLANAGMVTGCWNDEYAAKFEQPHVLAEGLH